MKVQVIAVLLCAAVATAGAQVPAAVHMGHASELVIKSLPAKSAQPLTVTSPAFKQGENIPYEFTQYRGNTFPGLSWTKGPAGTKSYAVIVQGQGLTPPAAGRPSVTSIHLTLYNVPATVTALKQGMVDPPTGANYAENIHGINSAYAGPHTHTPAPNGYYFQVFALDTVLKLDPATTFEAMVDAMTGHVLASGELMGASARDPDSKDMPLSQVPTRIETGMITGVQGKDRSITVYKGIPYAAPPVGDLRFKAPEPPKAWDGVFKADHFGKLCPQGGGGQGNNQDNMSEDCLTANVWTGAAFNLERRPVFVWIYGGGFSGGSGSNPEFDGEALAKKGIVVVTFNYRLGALGFLATPELSKESGHNASGNFGLLDDIALLKWVQKNIAAFGGDPKRVTVGGQSAGAGSTGFLSMSPLAKGLFVRAIEQSHARDPRDTELRYLATSYRTLKDAEAAGEKWEQSKGAKSLADLRAMKWQDLIVTMASSDDAIETGSDAKPPLFRPTVDGWVLPKGYAATFASHAQNNVAVMAGNNRDETGAVPESTFAQRRSQPDRPGAGTAHIDVTVDQMVKSAKRKFGPLADDFLKTYPAKTDDEAANAHNESARDNNRISTYLWASAWKPGTTKPVYTYFWTHRPTGDAGGAHHGSEILFVFNNLNQRPNQPWTDEDKKVADTVSSYWVNYISTGDPNGPGLARWPAFDAKSPTVMELGDHFGPIPVATPEHLGFWKRFFATQEAW
jgi:para-nitrobenzyl esterase